MTDSCVATGVGRPRGRAPASAALSHFIASERWACAPRSGAPHEEPEQIREKGVFAEPVIPNAFWTQLPGLRMATVECGPIEPLRPLAERVLIDADQPVTVPGGIILVADGTDRCA